MKKSIIAASASAVALAAMPMVGVFAADTTSHTDKLDLTINSICTLGAVSNGAAVDKSDATTHAPGANNIGTWTNGAESTTSGVGRTDTLAATVVNSTEYPNLGATTFTVSCNNGTGYALKALSGKNDGAATPVATLENGAYTIKSQTGINDLTVDGNSYWNFTLSNATGMSIAEGYTTNHVIPAGQEATTIASKATAGTTSGESVTVTYSAGIDKYQEAGTYTGTVVYTLVPNN